MPQFYLDIVQIDGTFRKDTVGIAADDRADAYDQARKLLSKMSEEAIRQDLSELRVEVRDDEGNVVALRAAFYDDDEVSGLPSHSLGSRQKKSKQRKVYR